MRAATGKPVLAYATGYSDDSYQLAAHASEVWMNPLGAVAIAGPGGNNLYFKGLFDKLGVTANVYRVGTYKAAVEPFTRTDMSPEARAERAGAGRRVARDVARRRQRARAPPRRGSIDAYLRDPVAMVRAAGGDFARAALATKLIDRAGERHAFDARLAELGGKVDDKAIPYRQIKLRDYVRDLDPDGARGPIGVVTVAGTIVDGKAGPGSAGGDSIAELIDEGVASGRLKALVVRIDSPGGSVMASEVIRQSILNAKAKGLPVVASMGNVAASGGYWVAMPGRHDLRRAVDRHRVDRGVRHPAELPGQHGQARARRRRGQDDAAVGRTRSAQRPLARGRRADPGRGRERLSPLPRHRRGVAQEERRPTSTASRRAACGTAGRRGNWGWSTSSAGSTRPSPRPPSWPRPTTAASPTSTSSRASRTGWSRCWRATRRPTARRPTPSPRFAPAPTALLARVIGEVSAIMAGPSIQVRCLDCPPGAVAAPSREAVAWWRLLAG